MGTQRRNITELSLSFLKWSPVLLKGQFGIIEFTNESESIAK